MYLVKFDDGFANHQVVDSAKVWAFIKWQQLSLRPDFVFKRDDFEWRRELCLDNGHYDKRTTRTASYSTTGLATALRLAAS